MEDSMYRTARTIAVGVVLALTVAACGDDGDEPSSTAAPATDAPATDPTGTDVPSTDPAAPSGSDDVPSTVERIVSLSPTHTEILYAIGADDLVVAVDDQSTYPPEAADKLTDLPGFTPNIEAIASYEPDLVVIGDDFNDLTSQLDRVGIAVWSGTAAVTFDDIYDQIEQLGAVTGRVGEAAELVLQMQTDIEAAVASVPEVSTPLTYYHELDPTFYSVTSNTFIGEVYGLFGLRNIADSAEVTTDYPQLSAEFIISENPDLVFLADTKCCGESPETVAARPGWGEIQAVITGHVIPVDDDIASRWGPRVVDYVQLVGAAVTDVAAVSAG